VPAASRPAARTRTIAVCLVACAFACTAVAADAPQAEPIVPVKRRAELNLDAKLVDLGGLLFADRLLSKDRTRSCTSCHPLNAAGADGRARAASKRDATLRNTPTIFNVGADLYLNWDGSFDRLEPHDERVLQSPNLMDIGWGELLARLRADRTYARLFGELRGPGVTRENVLAALAEFERSLTTPDSRFDRWLRGDRMAITADEYAGYKLFKGYGCVACHQGVNVGGNLRQKFGVFEDPDPARPADRAPDTGYFKTSQRELDREVFRVPSLRNVAVTPPYFHDGRAATLEVAVETMARVQLGRRLRPDQIHQIVLFLGTLTGEHDGVPLRALPAQVAGE
jgi:cytochrome c peroxidase